MMNVVVNGQSDRGRKRHDNQDSIFWAGSEDANISQAQIARNGYLLAVADGVGGIAGGREASRSLIKKFAHTFYEPVDGDLPAHLARAIAVANRDAFAANEFPNASTTLVAAVIHNGELFIANVGDSRAYLIRGNTIEQLTQDHVYGKRLLRYLVALEEANPDIFPARRLRSDDRVLLCSDGLYRMVEVEQMASLAAGHSPEQAAQALIRCANQNGGRDNISVIIAQILPSVEPIAAHLLPRWETVTPIQ